MMLRARPCVRRRCAGDVIILGNDGGDDPPPDYDQHMAAGNHLLMFGGSGTQAFGSFVATYFTTDDSSSWHTADDCDPDWTRENVHPITALMPATHEFADFNVSYHMVHFADAGQPANVSLLGRTCHQAPNNHVLAVRKYPGGGSFTYMALDLGQYSDVDSQAQFLVPFLTGYLDSRSRRAVIR